MWLMRESAVGITSGHAMHGEAAPGRGWRRSLWVFSGAIIRFVLGTVMLTVDHSDIRERLSFDNPWWAFKTGTRVRFRHPPKRAYFDGFLARVLARNPALPLILAGPLRVGKTVLLRQVLAEVIRRGTSPLRVLYASFTTPVYGTLTLEEMVSIFRQEVDAKPDDRVLIFLDEVEYLKDWQEQVRALHRSQPKARVVASVSSSAPGTVVGETADGAFDMFILPPLTFLEFLRFRDGEEKLLGGPMEKAEQRLSLTPNLLGTLNGEFHRYINFGGFPEGVIGGHGGAHGGAPAPTVIRDNVADRVLHKDLADLSGINDTQELNRLFVLLARNTARELAIENLARETSIAKNTLRKYLDYLEHAFLIRRVARLDRAGHRFQRQVTFKVYLTSTALHTAMFGPRTADHPDFPRLVETAVVNQWLGSEVAGRLAYASWKGGGIDLVTMEPGRDVPFYVYEFDWGDDYARSPRGPQMLAEFATRTGAAGTPYVLTHNIGRPARMGTLEMTLAPAALYAYWLVHKRLGRS